MLTEDILGPGRPVAGNDLPGDGIIIRDECTAIWLPEAWSALATTRAIHSSNALVEFPMGPKQPAAAIKCASGAIATL